MKAIDKPTYASTIKPTHPSCKLVPLKQISYLHGAPRINWEEEEVNQMIINEDLQYAVIGKFSYRWPEIHELRRLIPKQCELKGEVNIGLLSNIYILIRAMLLEDYVNLLSKPQVYITHKHWSYPIRTLKWDSLFDPVEETSIAIAWISFPSLPPNFFGKESIFSLATAVRKSLQVDLATQNKTRPSCAKVKVESYTNEKKRRIRRPKRRKERKGLRDWIRLHRRNKRTRLTLTSKNKGGKCYGRGRQMAKGGAKKVWYPKPKQTRTNEVTITNKFGALEGAHMEESHKERDNDRKDEEKRTRVEEEVQDTTQYEKRNNKKEVNNTQNSIIENDDAQSAIKVINIPDKSEQSVEGRNDKEKETDGKPRRE
ncbi:hypothetical protein H5410_051598 [Solanum commersonii]|uniref:DUF4283 domain-containing protein n=1 Tax=Solanum commersonii TaxID=4109 RepID=A0A9J5WYV8_SOLCO|nr:hypothetical protein H5410_051598 [Solanum commersonii]